MSLFSITFFFAVVLSAGYVFYARWVSKHFNLNPKALTPSKEFEDGLDFVPTKKFYLFGQHFSAIAAAGPIAGPILASQQFGWLPCLLWIALGVIFIGSVHDFSALISSVRHGGKSVAEILKETLSPRASLVMMIFIWVALIYVIVAFTDITASTFVGRVEELEGMKLGFERGGAVAMASTLYLLVGLIMGVVQKKFNPPLWLITVIFVPLTLGAVWYSTSLSTWFLFSKNTWVILILVYCFISSLLPVWLLLQPRGYLGGFILYLALAIGIIGVLFGGYTVEQPAFKTWEAGGMNGSLIPFLFVTIACGACSGFHGLVCSGTTSKQIASEPDCKPVGFGAMLLEGLVAVIALATVIILKDSEIKGSPGAIYGAGMGRFLTLILGPQHLIFAITFGAMAFSTFVFDTLDVTTRLGRYILQELLGSKGPIVSTLATLVTVGLPALFLLGPSDEGAWSQYWILFGTSNQLLAGLTLLGATCWLRQNKMKFNFVLWPTIFVMGITFYSLLLQIKSALVSLQGEWVVSLLVNGFVSVVLCVLALLIIYEAVKKPAL